MVDLFGRFCKVGLVWLVWFGLVNEDNLKRSLVPLKVALASLELNIGTIPGLVGPGHVGLVQVGPKVIKRLYPAQLDLELGWAW